MPSAYTALALVAMSAVGLALPTNNNTSSTTKPSTNTNTNTTAATSAVLSATQGGPLNITALATRNNISVIECWQLPGMPILLGSTVHWQLAAQAAQPEVTVLGPRTTVGQAWSSAVQLEILIAGQIKLTAPYAAANDTRSSATTAQETVYVTPGSAGSAMILTTDVRGASTTGHYAEFPGGDKTVVVQIPLANNTVPAHTVLHAGACTAAEADGAEGSTGAGAGGSAATSTAVRTRTAAATATATATKTATRVGSAAPTATDDGSGADEVDDVTDDSTTDDSTVDDSTVDDSADEVDDVTDDSTADDADVADSDSD